MRPQSSHRSAVPRSHGAVHRSQPKHGRNRQRLDLVTADPSREADRLISLGATRLTDLVDGIELADSDGNEFGLRAR